MTSDFQWFIIIIMIIISIVINVTWTVFVTCQQSLKILEPQYLGFWPLRTPVLI